MARSSLSPVVAGFMLVEPTFRKASNFENIGRQMAVVAILAVGETFVIIAGGIDLSVGAIVALSGVLAALTMRSDAMPPHLALPAGIAVGLGTGLFVGLLSGTIIEVARIPSFVVTLGMLGVCTGVAKIVSGGQGVSGLPRGIDWLAAHVSLSPRVGIPMAVVTLALIGLPTLSSHALVCCLRPVQSVKWLSGIPVKRVSVMTFVISGGLAGLAGLVALSRMGSGQPTAGQGYELNAVAAAVIGGTSLMGGEGSILGSFVGALIMAVIATGLDHMMVSQFIEEVVIGGMIIVAVIVDKLRRTMVA